MEKRPTKILYPPVGGRGDGVAMLKFEVGLSLTLESQAIVNTEYGTPDRRQIPPRDPPRLPAGERGGPVRWVVGARHRVGKRYSGDKFRFRQKNQKLPPKNKIRFAQITPGQVVKFPQKLKGIRVKVPLPTFAQAAISNIFPPADFEPLRMPRPQQAPSHPPKRHMRQVLW